MHRQSIPIAEVIVQDRQRSLNHEHVKSLAESIQQLGLIQPIVINQEKRLIAGGHRLAAHKLLGLTVIDFVYRETLSDDEFAELELTENLKRRDNTWQETCLAIAKIHMLKVKRNALDSKTWGQRDTGAFIGVNQASVSYSLIVAKELINDSKRENAFWKASNFNEAFDLIKKRQEDEALSRLANVQVTNAFEVGGDDIVNTNDIFPVDEEDIDLTKPWQPIIRDSKPIDAACSICKGRDVHCPSCGGTGYARDEAPKIPLLKRYIKGDSILYMNANPERFDHIITDIPYGIDIDYMNQDNKGIKNIDDIKAEHTVEGNEALFERFFLAAYHTLKPQGFCITWCDAMQWQRMYDLAVAAGFKVTRWPFIWCKTQPCLNQMAQYNFTKSTEFAMICRKGLITLPEKQSNNFILADRDDLCDAHPFAKPFAIWERLIEAVSIKNQSILDPFCGSGSAFISGVRLERIMYGCELDERLYNSGLENLKQFYLKLNPKAQFV